MDDSRDTSLLRCNTDIMCVCVCGERERERERERLLRQERAVVLHTRIRVGGEGHPFLPPSLVLCTSIFEPILFQDLFCRQITGVFVLLLLSLGVASLEEEEAKLRDFAEGFFASKSRTNLREEGQLQHKRQTLP